MKKRSIFNIFRVNIEVYIFVVFQREKMLNGISVTFFSMDSSLMTAVSTKVIVTHRMVECWCYYTNNKKEILFSLYFLYGRLLDKSKVKNKTNFFQLNNKFVIKYIQTKSVTSKRYK